MDPNTIEVLVRAFEARDVYVVAVFAALAIGELLKKSPRLWEAIPSKLQFLPALLTGFSAGFLDAIVAGLSVTEATVQGLAATGYVGFGSVGIFEVMRRAKSGSRQDSEIRVDFVDIDDEETPTL